MIDRVIGRVNDSSDRPEAVTSTAGTYFWQTQHSLSHFLLHPSIRSITHMDAAPKMEKEALEMGIQDQASSPLFIQEVALKQNTRPFG